MQFYLNGKRVCGKVNAMVGCKFKMIFSLWEENTKDGQKQSDKRKSKSRIIIARCSKQIHVMCVTSSMYQHSFSGQSWELQSET